MAEAKSTRTGRRWRAAAAAMLAAVVGTGALAAAPASADPSVRVSLGDASGLEHTDTQAGLFIPLTLSRATSSPVTVTYWTESGTATAGTDFVKWGTPTAPRTITIAAGARQTTINVPVKPDGETENYETFMVVLGSVTTGNATIYNGTGQGTIVDSSRGFNISSVAIVEGDEPGLKAQVRVEFAIPDYVPSEVPYYTRNGNAVAPTDYRSAKPVYIDPRTGNSSDFPNCYYVGTRFECFIAKFPKVVFAFGESSKTIDIPITSNETIQNYGNRFFFVDGPVSGGRVDIIDDDA